MLELTKLLRQHNLKVTPQRLAIFSMLVNSTAHPSAETIFNGLKEQHPTMSLATVYKTLDILTQNGLVRQINVGEDAFRYDANVAAHPHFICQTCGKVFDFPISNLDEFRHSVQQQTSFKITSDQFYFYGLCDDCKE